MKVVEIEKKLRPKSFIKDFERKKPI